MEIDPRTGDWQDVAKTAQKYRDESIARVKPDVPDVPLHLPQDVTPIPKELLSKKEVKITEILAEDLVESIALGKLTSTEVIKAFLRRAGLAQKLVSQSTKSYVEFISK